MASAIMRDRLLCSICKDIYTDPVTLRCGHNFCQGCIEGVLDTEGGYGVYTCPECRATFRKWPPLQRNITLCQLVENVLSTQPHQEKVTGICCTYCVDFPVPAVKSCLLCEVSVCNNHLGVHIETAAEHYVTEPSTSLRNRKCSIHKKILEYYCTEDAACICVSCSLAGEHRGHRVEMLNEASGKKKERLRNVLQNLITKREETEERVQKLEERRRKAQEKVSGEAERVTALCTDIRRRVDDLEKRVLSEISRQEKEEKVSMSLSDVIQKLEIKKDELSRKMRHIEELYDIMDPLIVLQEPDTDDLCDPEEEGGDEDTGGHDETHGDLDIINEMLHEGFCDIMIYLQTISPAKPEERRLQSSNFQSLHIHTQDLPLSGTIFGVDDIIVGTEGAGGRVMAEEMELMYGEGPADILLDVNTAHNYISISDDLKTSTWTWRILNHPATGKRFQDYHQVMSERGFTSGRHYWDVEISSSSWWRVGMCYPSIDRRGRQSLFGCNNKSWCLYGGEVVNNQCSMRHNGEVIQLPHQITTNRVRICLDYEAGLLSFYELCDPILYLDTFAAIFSEPLHAALCVREGTIKILGGNSCEEPLS